MKDCGRFLNQVPCYWEQSQHSPFGCEMTRPIILNSELFCVGFFVLLCCFSLSWKNSTTLISMKPSPGTPTALQLSIFIPTEKMGRAKGVPLLPPWKGSSLPLPTGCSFKGAQTKAARIYLFIYFSPECANFIFSSPILTTSGSSEPRAFCRRAKYSDREQIMTNRELRCRHGAHCPSVSALFRTVVGGS